MGNREALLVGARTVIARDGLEGATARTIAAAAGVSLGAIGYHFGGKDELVAAAAVELLDDGAGDLWTAALQQSDSEPAQAFADAFDGMLAGLEPLRDRLATGLAAMAAAQRSPLGQSELAARQEQALHSLDEVIGHRWPHLRGKERRAVARLALALMHGVVQMWLVDPATTPSGKQVATALVALVPARPTLPAAAPAGPAGRASGTGRSERSRKRGKKTS